MTNALISGGCGFTATSLGITLLEQGWHIVYVTRKQRAEVVESLQAATHGFLRHWSHEWLQRIHTMPWPERSSRGRPSIEIPSRSPWPVGIDVVFHTAAHPAMATMHALTAHEVNVVQTMQLYDAVLRHCPRAPRFVHFSSAYVCGLGPGPHREILPTAPKFIDTHHASKWAAELSLYARSREARALPITVVRPSQIVGHSRSGWYAGRSAHFYAQVEAARHAAESGQRVWQARLASDVAHHYICIDELVADLMRLVALPSRAFDIVHTVGPPQLDAWVARHIADAFGLDLQLVPASSRLDGHQARLMAWTERFSRDHQDWRFDTSHRDRLIATARQRAPLHPATFATLLEYVHPQGPASRSPA